MKTPNVFKKITLSYKHVSTNDHIFLDALKYPFYNFNAINTHSTQSRSYPPNKKVVFVVIYCVFYYFPIFLKSCTYYFLYLAV